MKNRGKKSSISAASGFDRPRIMIRRGAPPPPPENEINIHPEIPESVISGIPEISSTYIDPNAQEQLKEMAEVEENKNFLWNSLKLGGAAVGLGAASYMFPGMSAGLIHKGLNYLGENLLGQ